MTSPIAQEFVTALQNGFCCLHPTDTLPGLAGWPEHKTFPQMIEYVKGSRTHKSFLCLAPSLNEAQKFWQPLPSNWSQRLARLWPGPLTVVWHSHEDIPDRLVNDARSLAIRVPSLHPQDEWLYDSMREAGGLLPSTSVNPTETAPIQDWLAAAKFLKEFPLSYIPDISVAPPQQNQPSTIIEIERDGTYKILRHGAMTQQTIESSDC